MLGERDGVRLTRRQLLRGLGASGLLLTAGCTASRAADVSAVSGSGSPRRGGTIVLGQPSDIEPKSLIGQTSINAAIGRLVYNTLTEYDHATLQPRPSLATSWQQSADGMTMTLRLRDDVTFHTGRPFTAQDVIFTLRQQAVPANGSQLHATAAAITDMTAVTPHELVLRLKHPVSNLFDLFEMAFIIDRETFPELQDGAHLVGTGPFVFEEWNPGDSVNLTRNPHYWKTGLPYFDAAQIRIIPQAQSLVDSMRAGQVQIVVNLTPTDLIEVQDNPAFTEIVTNTMDQSYYIGCNVKVEPFGDRLVRQAISYAIDRQAILREVFLGMGMATSIPWTPANAAYQADLVNRYTYDPDRARSLLRQAGKPRLSGSLSINTSIPPTIPMAEIVQFNLGQVGIDITLNPLMQVDFGSLMDNGTLPGLWVNQHGWTQVHPASLATGAFPFNYAKNASNFASASYAAAAKQAWTSSSPSLLSSAYTELTDILLDEQFVVEGVISGTDLGMTSRLRGLTYNMYDYLILDSAWLEQAA
jgi:peptide/nickel transport system substrate-binding protein